MRNLLRRFLGSGISTAAAPTDGLEASTSDDRPIERWDEQKFAAVEACLKELPEDDWTPEDHYLMVEWTAQRHLSHDEPLTERQWAAAKLRLKGRVDAALEELRQGGDLGEAEWERRENERQRLGELLHEPMPLTEQQVREVILPLLAKFDFGPEPSVLTDEQVWRLAMACRDPYHKATSLSDRHDIRDCQDSLRMSFHPAVLETAQALAANYELLLRARRSGYTEVKLSVRTNCGCMAAALNGKSAPVEGLINAYEQRDDRYPVLPVPAVACASNEEPRICKVGLIALAPVDTSSPSYDDDFQRWATEIMGGQICQLEDDWASRLNR